MSIATDLRDGLADRLGPAEETIHTALPPAHLGGGADVLEFRAVPDVPGVVYVSAGGSPEIVVCTRAPAAWVPSLVSKLAAATAQRRFVRGGSVPLGDADAPFAGVAFTHLPRLYPIRAGERYATFLLGLGVTGAELALCRSHGVLHLVELLRAAELHPYSEPGRDDAPGVAGAGPSALEIAGLSLDGRDALAAVVHAQSEDVEMLRGQYPESDLPLLADAYHRLGAWEQRSELIALTQDTMNAVLEPVRRAFVAEALTRSIDPQTTEHGSLAVCLSILDGDYATFDTYWDDLAAALAKAREVVERS